MIVGKELPDGWQLVAFGDVAKQMKENADPESGEFERYIAGEHMDTDDLKIRRWGIIGDGYLGPAFHRKFRSGQILYGSRRTYLRKVAVADFDGICANTTFVIQAKSDAIYPDLLPFIMQTKGFVDHSIRNSKGSVNPYINWKDIASYQFPLPPKDEQRRIAKILWAIEDAIESYLQTDKAVSDLLWAEFDKVVHTKDYETVPLSECVVPRSEISVYPHTEEIYLGLEHFDSGSWDVNRYDDSGKYVSNCHVFKSGDLLYGKLRPYLDKCAIASFSGVCSTEILVLTVTNRVLIDYILYHFHSMAFVSYNKDKAYGTKMPRTSFDILSSYVIPVPTPEIQRQIVDNLDTIRLKKFQIQNQIQLLNNLKKCLISERLG